MPISLDEKLKDVPADRRAAIERRAARIVSDNRIRSETPGADPCNQPSDGSATFGRSPRDELVPDATDR